MILRVWAMYSRSILVLGTLLTLFSVETIYTIVTTAIYGSPKNVQGLWTLAKCEVYGTNEIHDHHTAFIIQTFNSSVCIVEPSSPISTKPGTILRIINGTAIFVFAIVQFVRQSLLMYRVTKQWQINRYMNILVKQGILYFFVYVYLLRCVPKKRRVLNQTNDEFPS